MTNYMFSNIFKKIVHAKSALTTYNLGLLQAKAYRILKNKTSELLLTYNISTIDWALIGLLLDKKEGLRFSEAALALGVEAPFVTVIVDILEEKKIVSRHSSLTDKRSKTIALTVNGKSLALKIEHYLKKETKFLVVGVSISELIAYRKVLKAIIENSCESQQK